MTHIRTVRNSKMSLFQSLVDDLVLGTHPSRRTAAPDRPTVSHPFVGAATLLAEQFCQGTPFSQEAPPEARTLPEGHLAWTCVKRAADLFLAKLEQRKQEVIRLENDLKDSECDPGWIEVIAEYLEHFGLSGRKDPIPYTTYQNLDDFVLETLAPNATIALLADWATGTQEAVRLLQQVARKKPDVLIHLGDIYYSGTHRETHANFLDICNRVLDRANSRIAIYTLTGNHDMYAGGAGYYSLLPLLNPSPPFSPKQRQASSFFSLRTSDGAWQFLAMDTGLHDHDPFTVSTDVTFLEPRESGWLVDKIDRFHAQGGRTILLSHHQLFSAFDYIGTAASKTAGLEAYNPKLLETFRGVLEKGSVSAWFWGHEHNLCIYEPYGPLQRGRCIGHGALPVFKSQNPYVVSDQIPDPPQLVEDPTTGKPLQLPLGPDDVYCHGYTLLKLAPSSQTAEVSYYLDSDEETPIFREVLS